MKRGGYDTYDRDEVLKRAHERGETVGWDLLFRAAGTAAESFWLIVLGVFVVAAGYLVGAAFLHLDPLTLAIIVTVIIASIAARIAAWLVTPYAHAIVRRSMWVLSAAALLLLLIRAGLAIAELFGRSMDAASARDFHVAVALLGLLIAIPVWLLYALWSWWRRRPAPQDRPTRLWRRGLPIVLVLGIATFLGSEVLGVP